MKKKKKLHTTVNVGRKLSADHPVTEELSFTFKF